MLGGTRRPKAGHVAGPPSTPAAAATVALPPSDRPGFLRIVTQAGSLPGDANNARSLLLQDAMVGGKVEHGRTCK